MKHVTTLYLAKLVGEWKKLCVLIAAAPVACFDRDWRLFRHVLNFLRDGTVPADPPLVWRL